MSTFRLAALAALLTATMPAVAQAQDGFAVEADASPLSDGELADVYGQGTPRGAFWRTSAREVAATYDQQNSALLPVTFANWFNDVGSPLIWNNVLAGR